MIPNFDWRCRETTSDSDLWYTVIDPVSIAPRTVTAPRTAEQSISLISAGVSALDGVAMTDDEKERVWSLVNKAMERLK